MSQQRYLLVDGHSVIYQWPELRALHARQPHKCREVLIKVLGDLHDTSDWLVTLVFDGKKGSNEPPQAGKMVVIYSQEGQTADSIIERLVAQVSDPSMVHVITADGAEKLTVESLGATVFSPDWLKDTIERSHTDWQSRLQQIHKNARWSSDS